MINLTSLLWLLGIGALFYWMMRKGGCGMHAGHSHGSHGHHEGGHGMAAGSSAHEAHRASERDPVCGMPVEPDQAAGMRQVRGRTFYLCSADCLAKFDRDPEGYASRGAESSSSDDSGSRHKHSGCC